jgi:hypothetical protein
MLERDGSNPQIVFTDAQLRNFGFTALGFVFWGVAIKDCGFKVAVNFGGGLVDGVNVQPKQKALN